MWRRDERRVRAGRRETLRVRVLEDVVLRAVLEVIQIGVKWWRVRPLEHVVALGLEPVERLLGTVRAVPRGGVRLAVGRVGTTAAGQLGLRERHIRSRTGNIALEAVHVVLFSAAVNRVDPKPGAVATSGRAGRHPIRDLEVCEAVPNARLVDTEYGEVFWLNLGHVRFVCDGERAALQVVETGRVHRTAREGVSAAGIVAIPHIAARGGLEERRLALVTGELGCGGFPCGKLEDVAGVGRIV